MSLYLFETLVAGKINSSDAFRAVAEQLRDTLVRRGARLREVQASRSFDRAFYVAEGEEASIVEALEEAGIETVLFKEVRLVGDDPEGEERQADDINYIVEWNLPADLTMDRYLERKRNNSIHYEKVPEVAFSRTYVCEDMSKCLCFYKAPDEAAVKRAREAVGAPVDAITEIAPQE